MLHNSGLMIQISPMFIVIRISTDVVDFLKENDLSEYCETFRKKKIDGMMLFKLSEELMRKDLGMRKLDAEKLMVRLLAEKDNYMG